MGKMLIVARKETKEILGNRTTILMGLGFAIFFSIMYSQSIVSAKSGNISLDGSIFYLSLAIAIFMAYISSGQIFLLEKRDGVIETLMCAPVSLRQIWAGKTVAGAIPSWLVAIFATLLLSIITSIRSGVVLVPGIDVIVHVLLVVPIFIASFCD